MAIWSDVLAGTPGITGQTDEERANLMGGNAAAVERLRQNGPAWPLGQISLPAGYLSGTGTSQPTLVDALGGWMRNFAVGPGNVSTLDIGMAGGQVPAVGRLSLGTQTQTQPRYGYSGDIGGKVGEAPLPINVPTQPTSPQPQGITTQTDDYGNVSFYKDGLLATVVNAKGEQIWPPANPMENPTVLAALIAAGSRTAPVGAQFDWTKTAEGTQAGYAADEEKQRIANQGAQIVAEIQGNTSAKVAQINADTTLTTAEKQVEIARISAQSAKDAAEATAAATRYSADLDAAAKQRQTEAELSIAQGNWDLGYAQMQSAERITAAKAQVDREIAGLNTYGQLLQVESQERGQRANAAASVFNTLATLAPADQLRSAFFLMRGQAPPPSATTQLPAGLLSALGVNPDTATAAAQQLRGSTSIPPWLAGLMGAKGGV